MEDIIFNLFVFNVAKYPAIRVLNAYFVISTSYFLRFHRHHLFLRGSVGLRLPASAAEQ
jgi:hypothetical protein